MWESTSTIESHPPCPGQAVVFRPNAFHGLLAHDIPSRKEDLYEATSAIELGGSGIVAKVYSRGYGLCQDGPLRKLHLIPVKRYAISLGSLKV